MRQYIIPLKQSLYHGNAYQLHSSTVITFCMVKQSYIMYINAPSTVCWKCGQLLFKHYVTLHMTHIVSLTQEMSNVPIPSSVPFPHSSSLTVLELSVHTVLNADTILQSALHNITI